MNFVVVTLFYQIFAYLSFLFSELLSNIYCSTTVLLVENFDVELTDEPTTVYNFQVEDFHTYYAGGLGVLVHNAGKEYGKQYSPEQQKLVKEGKN